MKKKEKTDRNWKGKVFHVEQLHQFILRNLKIINLNLMGADIAMKLDGKSIYLEFILTIISARS